MNYAKIKWFDISNGPGVRASLFVSGCTHECKNCFNKEAWDFKYGKPWTKEIEDKLIEHLNKEEIKGVNILGGEPLQQDETLLHLLLRISQEVNKPIWLWTGYDIVDVIHYGTKNQRYILYSCNVVIDGKFEEDKKNLNLKYRGSSNQRIIDMDETFKQIRNAANKNQIFEAHHLVELEGYY